MSQVAAGLLIVGVDVFGLLRPDIVLGDVDREGVNILSRTVRAGREWYFFGLVVYVIVGIPLLSLSLCEMCTVSRYRRRHDKRRLAARERARRRAGYVVYRGGRRVCGEEDFERVREELRAAVRGSGGCEE